VDTPYGGTAQPSDFAITVTGSNVSTPNFSGSATGTSVTLDANQNYSVSESSVAGYTQTSMSPECSGTLAPYESKTCTIINTQDAPPPIDTEEIIPNRRTSSSANPKITIKKTANPLALSAGAGFVSYAYLVENTGNVSLSNIKVVDNHCTYVNYVFGDSDEYDVLEVGETWSYICTDYLT
jgi:hypothetical protein